MDNRLLFITCHKLDDNNGGANASKGFLHCFAALFDDCSLIYPEFEDTQTYIPPKYKRYPCHDSRPRLRKGLDMYRGVLGGIYYCVRQHLATHAYDVIVVDHSVTGTSLMRFIRNSGAKVITIHHNVERHYLRDNGKERPITYRLPYNHFARKAERDCLRYSDLNLTLTERDAAVFRSWYKHDIHALRWGIFEYRPLPDKTFAPKPAGATFVITGSLCFLQSLMPILDFIGRYWPLVRQTCPGARLIVAGRQPSKTLVEACQGQPDISIIPNPDNMTAIVQKGNYYICPINAGSGLKLRVMDGLKQGMPVLCHDISASGYENLTAAGCLFSYHDEQTFAAALRQMLSTTHSPDAVYQSFRENFSLEAGIKTLRHILRQEQII